MTTPYDLPPDGYVRLATILRLIPISKSTWWHYVAVGRAPHPVRLGPNTVAWRVEDIRHIIEHGFANIDEAA